MDDGRYLGRIYSGRLLFGEHSFDSLYLEALPLFTHSRCGFPNRPMTI